VDYKHTLRDARRGYEIYTDVSVSHDPGGYRLADRDDYPTVDVVSEIGRVADAIGDRPAQVYASAVASNGNVNSLARDLVSFGPWSWALDVWFSAEAEELYPDTDQR